MSLENQDALFIALTFLVPGFIVHAVRSAFIARRDESTELSLLRYITLSSLNYALWSWLVYLLLYSETLKQHPVVSALMWGWILLLGPTALGALLGYDIKNEWLRRFLQGIGLRPIHVIPTAWDWRFSHMDEARSILVTLKGGELVAGVFGENSFASSDPEERDLFLEEVCSINDDGTWVIDYKGKGILIKGDEIARIEIWPKGEIPIVQKSEE